MKRTVLHILIGLALCLQACHSNLEPEQEMAIGMSATSVESTTRALINSAADLEIFKVDAYKEGTSNEQVFSEQSITRNGDKWEYNPVRYWDRKGYYYFGAYSPENIAVSSTNTKGVLSISAPNWQAINGEENDIVVATSKGAATGYIGEGGTVKFEFMHILSQLKVQIVRSSMLTNTYKLTGLTYKTVPTDNNNATTTYTFNYAAPGNSAMSTAQMGEKIVFDGAEIVGPEATPATTFTYMVVPFGTQTEDGVLVEVRYTVNDVPATPIVVKTKLKTLEAGNRYVLTLRFDSGADIKPILTVCGWNEDYVDEDDKYNW